MSLKMASELFTDGNMRRIMHRTRPSLPLIHFLIEDVRKIINNISSFLVEITLLCMNTLRGNEGLFLVKMKNAFAPIERV